MVYVSIEDAKSGIRKYSALYFNTSGMPAPGYDSYGIVTGFRHVRMSATTPRFRTNFDNRSQ